MFIYGFIPFQILLHLFVPQNFVFFARLDAVLSVDHEVAVKTVICFLLCALLQRSGGSPVLSVPSLRHPFNSVQFTNISIINLEIIALSK